MKSLLFFLLIFCVTPCIARVTVIETGTESMILQIERRGDFIILNGRDSFLARCYGQCDSIIPLTAPGIKGFSNRDLNLMDTNVMYILSASFEKYHTYIYKSINSGENWQLVFDSSNIYFDHLAMFDVSEEIILSTFDKLLRTTDGGENWERGSHRLQIVSDFETYEDSIICIGASEGFCLSKDRGRNWVCNGFIQNNPRDIFFLNRDTILFSCSSSHGVVLAYSLDGGNNWKQSRMPSGFQPYGVDFKSINEGYIVGHIGDSAVVIKTTDLGKTWQLFNTGLRSALLDIEFLNDSIALVSGTQGMLFRVNVKEAFPTVAGFDKQEKQLVEISLYPNPTYSSQTLSFSLSQPEHLEIFLLDLSGRHISTVHKGYAGAGLWQKTISLENLQSGCYLLHISTANETRTLKVVRK